MSRGGGWAVCHVCNGTGVLLDREDEVIDCKTCNNSGLEEVDNDFTKVKDLWKLLVGQTLVERMSANVGA
jgi:hypothetical protein